ncbi:MAG: arsenate reductase (glutaredoxin) [Bacteroidales bacterium]|nr:arsenate reductase (glutaredoxin) [Bacteroidales bacterium]
MVRIYHNPRCRKSRAGLDFLNQNGSDPEVVDYMNNPPSEKDLEKLLIKLGKKPHDIVRTQEELYRKDYKGKNLSDTEWLKVLVQNPRLIRRPIVETDNKAVIGDPVENIKEIL